MQEEEFLEQQRALNEQQRTLLEQQYAATRALFGKPDSAEYQDRMKKYQQFLHEDHLGDKQFDFTNEREWPALPSTIATIVAQSMSRSQSCEDFFEACEKERLAREQYYAAIRALFGNPGSAEYQDRCTRFAHTLHEADLSDWQFNFSDTTEWPRLPMTLDGAYRIELPSIFKSVVALERELGLHNKSDEERTLFRRDRLDRAYSALAQQLRAENKLIEQ